jgi:serine/threonine-protein kinase RsbW
LRAFQLEGQRKQDAVRPTGPSSPTAEFSPETLDELLRALHARAIDHPESPGLIASWPGVPAERMPAACALLRGQGHAVHEVTIVNRRGDKVRRGWTVEHANGAEPAPAGPPASLAAELTLLVRAAAEPEAVPLARSGLTAVAQRAGVPADVCAAMAMAVTEACANVVLHAYVDADAPGDLVVRAGKTDAAVVVEVSDDGRGLVARIGNPRLGLGLPLIAQVSDALELRTGRKHPGLVLRMRFDLDGTDRPG